VDIRAIALEMYKKALNSDFSGSSSVSFPEGLSPSDKAFIKRLVMTTLRQQLFLRKVLSSYASKKLPNKLDGAQMAAVLGAAEILNFHTPDYAIVNSYVTLAKKYGNKYSGGFVNAVLRKVCRDCEKIAQSAHTPVFPQSFISLLKPDYTKEAISAIETAAGLEPPLDITVKQNPGFWAEKLGGKVMGNGTVRLFDAGNVGALPGFQEGEWWVQDLASSLAVAALGNISNQAVLDLCAAPGGKTAQLINAGAKVTALDISASRLEILQQNLRRLNLKAEKIITSDALEYLKTAPQYDIILTDAPCSATGTLRRHPEIVHTRSDKDIEINTDIQQKMLEAAAHSLKDGGILLYSVCSLCKKEGEAQIRRFLKNNTQFRVVPIAESQINPFRQPGFNDLITSEGYIRCLPSYLSADGGMDGFFVAKLQKGAPIND